MYSYPDPVLLLLLPVSSHALLIRAYPTAPAPKVGIGASMEYSERILPFNGAASKMNKSPSIKKSNPGTRSLLS